MKNNTEGASAEKLVPQPTRLVDLIDYQKGSVVSREIIKKKTEQQLYLLSMKGKG